MAHHPFPWRDAFLAALREWPVVAHACQAVGIERSTAYRAREADEAFAKAWDEAQEDGIDRAEMEAFRRGVVGFEEPVVYKGSIPPLMAPVFDDDGKPVIDELTKTQKWAPVLDDKGRPVPLTVRKHSDALLALVLKARRKAYSTERTELTGAEGGPVQTDDAARAARVAQLMALAERRRASAADDFSDLA